MHRCDLQLCALLFFSRAGPSFEAFKIGKHVVPCFSEVFLHVVQSDEVKGWHDNLVKRDYGVITMCFAVSLCLPPISFYRIQFWMKFGRKKAVRPLDSRKVIILGFSFWKL